MKKFILLFALFFVSYTFSQRKDTIRQTYSEADTVVVKVVETYLGSGFKRTGAHFREGKYILTQHQVLGAEIGWFDKKVHTAHLDSCATVVIDFVPFSRIIHGKLCVRRCFGLTDYTIENGYITVIKKYNRKGTKLKMISDWSGLSTGKKIKPTFTVYRKNGRVKIYIDNTCYIA